MNWTFQRSITHKPCQSISHRHGGKSYEIKLTLCLLPILIFFFKCILVLPLNRRNHLRRYHLLGLHANPMKKASWRMWDRGQSNRTTDISSAGLHTRTANVYKWMFSNIKTQWRYMQSIYFITIFSKLIHYKNRVHNVKLFTSMIH